MVKETKVWYEGEKIKYIIFTEEDLDVVLKALSILSKDMSDEYYRVKTRICFQTMEFKK